MGLMDSNIKSKAFHRLFGMYGKSQFKMRFSYRLIYCLESVRYTERWIVILCAHQKNQIFPPPPYGYPSLNVFIKLINDFQHRTLEMLQILEKKKGDKFKLKLEFHTEVSSTNRNLLRP